MVRHSDETLYTRDASASSSTTFEAMMLPLHRGKHRARYELWQLSDEPFETLIERWSPLVKVSLRERFRRGRHRHV